MQVITGKYKGRRLISPDCARPTLQRIKQSLFSMIASDINESAVVLDLFAGSGALGIECISRGAKKTYFVDKSKDAIKAINQNLKNVERNSFEILNTDYLTALKNFRGMKFDIVFIDPPYDEEGLLVSCIEIIERFDLLNDDAIVVVETSNKNILQDKIKGCIIEKKKDYGLMEISVLRKVQ